MKNRSAYLLAFAFLSIAHAQTYSVTTSSEVLGPVNESAAGGNPMKGLLTSPLWTGDNPATSIPTSLEFYSIKMNDIMTGPDSYNWDALDQTIKGAKARNNHVIWRVIMHSPPDAPAMPQFLIDQDLVANGQPKYDHLEVRSAMERFITAFARYDGNKHVAFIQMGLIGKWGEWHTYPETGILSDTTKGLVFGWYTEHFKKTKLQVRDPMPRVTGSGIGYHDDSFAFSTLDGAPNGGETVGWFFWPKVVAQGQTDFWKTGVMGGETRPELQAEIFEPGYAAGTSFKQDFFTAVDVTHATYMLHHNAFVGSGYTGAELVNARRAHSHMGYNFQVTKVAAAKKTSSTISVSVTVKQIGIAPFYYPLSLGISCEGMKLKTVSGLETLLPGNQKTITFDAVNSLPSCLGTVRITLESDYTYAERPIKFAQGVDGRVELAIPPPSSHWNCGFD